MCGRFNAIFDSDVKKLYTGLKINKVLDTPIDKHFVKAADTISIVRNRGDYRVVENAMWWLLLEQTKDSFKPSKYTSFNTRYDKLNIINSAGYQAYRESRCVIAVKGFGETEFINKKPIHYYDMQAENGGLLLGGLCRDWIHKKTGEVKTSCSVITLPAHEKLKNINSKSMPLILPQTDSLINLWLNNSVTEVEQFSSLLQPYIPQNLRVQKVDKPNNQIKLENDQLITHDRKVDMVF